MNWAGIVIIVLLAMEIGASLVVHGQHRKGDYNFFTTFIWVSIIAWLMFKAGTFG